MSSELPAGTVGLSTGEEEIDPDAPILCCTVEKAPMRGDLLVLDESHWVADPDRGHHWARLVLTGNYREMHLISAAEAYLLLKPLVSDAKKITVVNHKRLSRLDVLRAPVRPNRVRPQTLVVAFSRKAVYAVAAALAPKRPGKVGVLYGALPPATRRDVIDRFTRGELEVLVTTDVIGHGINVPATTVLFAETTKFDGVERRPLRTWETAQIAGRAGRYGLTGHGTAGVLSGIAGLKPDAGLLVAGAEGARGDEMSDLPKRAPRLRPELDDLGAFEPVDLPEALTRWMACARAATRDQAMTADDVTGTVLRVNALLPLLKGPLGAAGDLWTVWRLVNLPIDYSPPRRTRWLTLAQAAPRSAAALPGPPGPPPAPGRSGRRRSSRSCRHAAPSRTTSRPPPRPATRRPCCVPSPVSPGSPATTPPRWRTPRQPVSPSSCPTRSHCRCPGAVRSAAPGSHPGSAPAAPARPASPHPAGPRTGTGTPRTGVGATSARRARPPARQGAPGIAAAGRARPPPRAVGRVDGPAPGGPPAP